MTGCMHVSKKLLVKTPHSRVTSSSAWFSTMSDMPNGSSQRQRAQTSVECTSKLSGQQAFLQQMHAVFWKQQGGCPCLSNGVEVGQARQGLSTDVGDHVLVQGHIRSMHEVCHTAAATMLHHYPQRLTATPAALCTTPGIDPMSVYILGGRGVSRGLGQV